MDTPTGSIRYDKTINTKLHPKKLNFKGVKGTSPLAEGSDGRQGLPFYTNTGINATWYKELIGDIEHPLIEKVLGIKAYKVSRLNVVTQLTDEREADIALMETLLRTRFGEKGLSLMDRIRWKS
ncbi:MAG: hypothetical protein HQL06_02390 [Nitrospirae bacterium]|nr:hypothetical protein [Nitrospirota bacterium]